MSELSEAAQALIRDGQSVLRPTIADRSRVASALASRLGEGAVVASAAGATAGRWVLWQKVAGLVVGVGVAGLGASWALREPPPAEPTVAPSQRFPTSLAANPSVASVPAAPSEVEELVPSPSPAAPAVRQLRAADRLAEEVGILSKATGALRSGRPAEALRLLNEHQQRFPSGRLVEERRAARIQALCALGNRGAAEAELTRLARSSPRSPHLARAQQACGFSKTGG
ncbi:MAG: hypothetical protein EOO73_15545 [Myxococcales bacterium]|nr:MAG: hypothetical protein EOO73_15545 [Myxococcales bacterium]